MTENTNPAFKLVVGVNEELTFTEFKNGIERVIKDINKTPYKINFAFDENSITKATEQAEKIGKALKGAVGDSTSKQVSNIKARVSKFKEIQSAFANETNLHGNQGALKALNSALAEYDNIAKKCRSDSKAFLSQINQTGKNGTSVLQRMDAAAKALKGDLSAYLKVNNLTEGGINTAYKNVVSKLEGSGYTTELETIKAKYGELITLTERWKQSGSNMTSKEFGAIVGRREELQELIAQTYKLIDAEETETKQRKQNQKSVKDVTSIINKYNNAVLTGEKRLKDWSAAENSKNKTSQLAYQKLRDSINAMKNAKEAYDKGSGSITQVDEATKAFQRTLKETQRVLQSNGDATKSLKDKLGGLAKKFGAWLSASQAVMYAVRAVRQMITTSIELDSAMAQMQIVTKANSTEMEEFGKKASKAAQDTASSVTDIINSSTTYARLGYNMDDSTELAQYTAMLQKVGDIDVEDAQNAITAILKAYDVDASDIESIMDKLIETGNNYPISVSQIAEGMNNASSTLAAAGNSFEQSVALLTAANTTIQDAAKSSTGLRTITARIRNTKTELDDLGEAMSKADYENLVKTLTDAKVALTDNGEYRSTYDIMSDIAAKWGEMTSMEQAAMATALSGTRQQAVFYSIIEQFKEASGAMDSMANSSGALDKAYAVVLDTSQAHIDQLKAKFQELSADVMDSDLIKFIVDIGSAAIETVDNITKLGGGLPGIIGGALAAIKVKNIGRAKMFVLK